MKFSYVTEPHPSGSHRYVVLRDESVITVGYRPTNADATVAARDDTKLARLLLAELHD